MQRARMSLPYFREFGWAPAVVTLDPSKSDIVKDELLLETIPAGIKVYRVGAFNKKWTSKFGLGSDALRSLWHYRQKVNAILKNEKYDLIYFSTTQFPLCILGAYWKERFGIPYIIDMQDPWHSDYYRDKPKGQQPAKYWFSYPLHKYLEPIAMKKVDGLISVSDHYIHDLKARYPEIKEIPSATITFGAFGLDLKIAADNQNKFKPLLQPRFKNIVYIGRGGMDMHKALVPVFETLKTGLTGQPELFGKIKFYFIGTSYAPAGKGAPTILPLAEKYGVGTSIIEITDRISYYQTLLTLQQADALFIPGSDDPRYTASKIYPYLLTHKPLLSIFNSRSGAVAVFNEFGLTANYTYDKTENLLDKIYDFLFKISAGEMAAPVYCKEAEEKYSARKMTERQCIFFNKVLNGEN
jgi:hypothetical protein